MTGLALMMAAGACGATTGLTASLSIDSPANNATVNAPANKKVAVNFSTNFTLRTTGQCAGIQNCGHVWLLVDSTSCNQQGQPYNTLVVSSPAQADLSLCQKVTGPHTITLVLHDDAEQPVKDVLGNPATSTVTINVQ